MKDAPTSSVLPTLNRVLTALGWAAYPLLLAACALTAPDLLVRLVCVPAAGFAICTVLRAAIDAPRPYEESDVQAAIPKKTRGRSFPSRHVFSMATIALSWLFLGLFWPPALVVGALLFASSIFMAWARVELGVHYARDVVAGLLLAACVCAVGFVFRW